MVCEKTHQSWNCLTIGGSLCSQYATFYKANALRTGGGQLDFLAEEGEREGGGGKINDVTLPLPQGWLFTRPRKLFKTRGRFFVLAIGVSWPITSTLLGTNIMARLDCQC